MNIDSEFGNMMAQHFGIFDMGGFSFFAGLHCDMLTFLANLFSSTGSSLFWFMICLLALFLVLFKKTRTLAFYVGCSVFLSFIISDLILNPVFGRIRPYNVLQENAQYFSWYLEVGGIPESVYCFPSKHATCAIAVALSIFYYVQFELKKKTGWIALLWAALVSASRVYLMVHYPTDVLCGVLLGIIIGIGSICIYKFLYYFFDKFTPLIQLVNKLDLATYLLHKKHICITKRKLGWFFVLVPLCFVIISFAYQMRGQNGSFHKCFYSGKDYICLNKAENKSSNVDNDKNSSEDDVHYYCDLHKDLADE